MPRRYGVVRIGLESGGGSSRFGIRKNLLRGIAPIVHRLGGALSRKSVLSILRPEFHEGAKWQGLCVSAFEGKGFLECEGKIGIFLHQGLEELFVYAHHGNLAADLNFAVDDTHVFSRADLFWFIR